ncbi:hypothetical protein SVAN01_02764 [Stagonosporopsis vannaccii]|nr:hypothetical protein SVAN01_02764 [Stagonosporopsis vannaccii]
MARSLRSDRHEDPLQKLRRHLQIKGLRGVLESLPAPDRYNFQSTRRSGHAAIKVCLGNRKRLDGTRCQAWACIDPAERRDLQPPVTFYDQESLQDGKRSLHRRISLSATSLLRRATDLEPPFCFLQHDAFDDVKDARNMLCAIVLYQAMVVDVEKCALQWNQFGDSLSRALQYIYSRGSYHQWRQELDLATSKLTQLSGRQNATKEAGKNSKDVRVHDRRGKESQAGTSSSENYTGGEVRPGSGIVIKPNTTLARLMDELGDKKAHLLDEMPRLPMKITPHNLGPSYFPFCMLIGGHTWESGEPFQIYAYIEQDKGKGARMRFLGHDDTGHEQSFTMDQLLGTTLLEPFEYLNNFKNTSYADGRGSSARTAKIRSVISYYFFLAEHAGLIGDPRVRIGEAFGKRLCAAIKEMRGATFTDDNSSKISGGKGSQDDSANIDVSLSKPMQCRDQGYAMGTKPAGKEKKGLESSRIVILRTISKKIPSQGREERIAGTIQTHCDQADTDNSSAYNSSADDAQIVQPESRPLSQNTHKVREHLTSVLSGWGTTRQASEDVTHVEAPLGESRIDERGRYKTPKASNALSGGQATDMIPIATTTIAEETESDAHLIQNDTNTVQAKTAILFDDRDLAGTEAAARTPSQETWGKNRQTQAAVAQNLSDSDGIPMDISSPTSAKFSTRAPSIPTTICRDKSGVHDPLSASIGVAHLMDNKPPTPKSSIERQLRPQTTTIGVQEGSRHDPVTIDSGSDGDNIMPALRIPRLINEPILRYGNIPADLTQTSLPSRDRKRKPGLFMHQYESEDEAISETDGKAHRWAQMRRRR